MSNIRRILEYNTNFVENKKYEPYLCDRLPNKKLAILTCMDTRLVELLPKALGIRNGDVKMVKCAGAMITGPYDSTVRSLLIGITELNVNEIMVIGHTNCGAAGIKADQIIRKLINRGVSRSSFNSSEIDFDTWLSGFGHIEDSVRGTVNNLRNHPLIPKDVYISGHVIDVTTGKLNPVEKDN